MCITQGNSNSFKTMSPKCGLKVVELPRETVTLINRKTINLMLLINSWQLEPTRF